MTSSNEEFMVNNLIARFRNLYPKAVAAGKDKNLVGRFLEQLTGWAVVYLGLCDYDGAVKQGDRGIDVKIIDDSFEEPLLIAIECMNGKYDYTEPYFENLKKRMAKAYSENHIPLIVCVDRKVNFKRFKGTFGVVVYYIELGKQYHPNNTKYEDYLALKSKLKNKFNKIAKAERPEEMAQREFLTYYEHEILSDGELKAFEKSEEEEIDNLLNRLEKDSE